MVSSKTRAAGAILALTSLAALGLGAPKPAAAQSVTDNFSLGGFMAGGQLIGTFTGTPEADGTLQVGGAVNDLTAFTATFSGNSLVPAGTVGLGDLQNFFYGYNSSVGANILSFYATNNQISINPAAGVNGGGPDTEGVSYINTPDNSSEDFSFATASVMPAVPEPSPLVLMAVGLTGVILLGFHARRRISR